MRIRWTEPAAADLSQICDHIEKDRGRDRARVVAVSIYESVGTLRNFPEKGRLGRRPGTRELILPGLPYLAVYRIHEGTAQILRVLHGAQKWP